MQNKHVPAPSILTNTDIILSRPEAEGVVALSPSDTPESPPAATYKIKRQATFHQINRSNSALEHLAGIVVDTAVATFAKEASVPATAVGGGTATVAGTDDNGTDTCGTRGSAEVVEPERGSGSTEPAVSLNALKDIADTAGVVPDITTNTSTSVVAPSVVGAGKLGGEHGVPPLQETPRILNVLEAKKPKVQGSEAKESDGNQNEAARFMSDYMNAMDDGPVLVTFHKERLGLVLRRPKDPVVVLGRPIVVKKIQPVSEAYKPLVQTCSAGSGSGTTPADSSLKAIEWLLCEINGANVAHMSYQQVLGLIVRGQRPFTAKFKPLLFCLEKKKAPLFCPICARCACNSKAKVKQQTLFCKGLCAKLLGDNEHSSNAAVEELEWDAPLRSYDEFAICVEHIPTTNDKAISQWWGDLYSRLQLHSMRSQTKKTAAWCSMNKRDADAHCLSFQNLKLDKTREASSTKMSTYQLAGASVHCYATSSTPWSMANGSLFSNAKPAPLRGMRRCRYSAPTSNAADRIKHTRKAASDGACVFQPLSFEGMLPVLESQGSSTFESSGIEPHLYDKVEVSTFRSTSGRSSAISTSRSTPGGSSVVSRSAFGTSLVRSSSSVRSITSSRSLDKWCTSSNDSEDFDDELFEQTRSIHSSRKEELISNMPCKARRLLVGNDDPNFNAPKTKRKPSSKTTKSRSVAKKVFNIARSMVNKSAVPAFHHQECSSSLFADVDDLLAAGVASEPCINGFAPSSISRTTELDELPETFPISGDNAKEDSKETTVAILLPKCTSSNRPHDKVVFVRVRTKKEASNLATAVKRNVFAKNTQVFLEACRNNDTRQLGEVLENFMSKEDIQSIRAGGCCEAIGKRGIEDAIKHNNLSSLKLLLKFLVR